MGLLKTSSRRCAMLHIGQIIKQFWLVFNRELDSLSLTCLRGHLIWALLRWNYASGLRIILLCCSLAPVDLTLILKHIQAETKWPPFSRQMDFKCIFLNENAWIFINMSLKFVPKGPISNIPTLVQVMAWRRPGDKPLSEPMLVRLPTHICVTRP